MTKGENVRIKFYRCIELFLVEGGSYSYDDESIGDIEVPLKYKNLVKQWVPKELLLLDTDFSVNNRMYHIAPFYLHGLARFSMDRIALKYNIVTELMDYVRPCYDYSDWIQLVQYMRSTQRYALTANYIQLINNDKNKGVAIYIDGRPKSYSNIAWFINNT